MPENERTDLVDQTLIAASAEKLSKAQARAANATADLAVAKQQVLDAENAAHLAAEGRGKLSPLDAERALSEAQLGLRAAEKVAAAAAMFQEKCGEWAALAQGAAHSGLYLAGLRGRIAAAEKAEQAKALLLEAERDMQNAAAMCHQAHVAGHPHILGVSNRPQFASVTAAEERAVIAGAGVDIETGKYPWLEYVKSSEPEQGFSNER